MELKIIEQLLEKYFDAETSTAEEKQLKAYFSLPDVAPHLEQYRPMFGYFANQATQQFEKTVPFKVKKQYGKWMSIAASLVLMAGMLTWFNASQPTASDNELGTYSDPETAFKETQKALNMVSKNVNVGVNSMDYLGEYEKSKKTIFKD
jgi:hypothetical protein